MGVVERCKAYWCWTISENKQSIVAWLWHRTGLLWKTTSPLMTTLQWSILLKMTNRLHHFIHDLLIYCHNYIFNNACSTWNRYSTISDNSKICTYVPLVVCHSNQILQSSVHLHRKQPVMLDLKHLTFLWQNISTENTLLGLDYL